MTDTPDLDGLLADRTPWTLADIVREIGMVPAIAAEYALRSLRGGPGPHTKYPAPLPESPSLRGGEITQLFELRRQAERSPDVNDLDWVVWAAGDIRRWALENCRIGRDMQPVKLTPPRRPMERGLRRTPGPRYPQ